MSSTADKETSKQSLVVQCCHRPKFLYIVSRLLSFIYRERQQNNSFNKTLNRLRELFDESIVEAAAWQRWICKLAIQRLRTKRKFILSIQLRILEEKNLKCYPIKHWCSSFQRKAMDVRAFCRLFLLPFSCLWFAWKIRTCQFLPE